MSATITLTLFRKAAGPLTKRIRLDAKGHVVSDGSACLMAEGTAERIELADIAALGALIERMGDDQALGLGARARICPTTAISPPSASSPRLTVRRGPT